VVDVGVHDVLATLTTEVLEVLVGESDQAKYLDEKWEEMWIQPSLLSAALLLRLMLRLPGATTRKRSGSAAQ
jgi:hypothetical protein